MSNYGRSEKECSDLELIKMNEGGLHRESPCGVCPFRKDSYSIVSDRESWERINRLGLLHACHSSPSHYCAGFESQIAGTLILKSDEDLIENLDDLFAMKGEIELENENSNT